MAKPYAFRFPSDIRSTLEPWREQLNDSRLLSGSGGFDTVIAQLADRDRAIEDYLSLGVAQGQLGVAFSPVGTTTLLSTYTALPLLTVSYTVPAGRQIKITAHARIYNGNAGTTTGHLRLIDETAAAIAGDYYFFNGVGTAGGILPWSLVQYLTPAAGTHSVTFEAKFDNNNGKAEALTNSNHIIVEDVGPATR